MTFGWKNLENVIFANIIAAMIFAERMDVQHEIFLNLIAVK